jgi:hypothetical protein
MPDTTKEVVKPDAVTNPPKKKVNDECSFCGALRGQAPEGVHDYYSALKHEADAGDPKWVSHKCWRCGAEY